MTFAHIIGKIQRSFVEIHDRTTSQEADFATICQHFQGQTESWDNSSIKSRLESSDTRINIHISVLKWIHAQNYRAKATAAGARPRFSILENHSSHELLRQFAKRCWKTASKIGVSTFGYCDSRLWRCENESVRAERSPLDRERFPAFLGESPLPSSFQGQFPYFCSRKCLEKRRNPSNRPLEIVRFYFRCRFSAASFDQLLPWLRIWLKCYCFSFQSLANIC